MLKVMVVDDDKNVIDCFRGVIPWEQLNCTLIATAGNGDEAYAMAIEHAPDVIICDVVMPIMDGTTLCKKIYETMSDVAFIFLSAYEDFSIAQTALQYHARDYILKPLNRVKINYIIKLLEELSVQNEKQRYYMKLLHDKNMGENINKALMEKDISFFENLFHKLTQDVIELNVDINHIRDIVCRLLNLLFDYRYAHDQQNLVSERADVFEQVDQSKLKMDMIMLTSEYYFQYLRSVRKTQSLAELSDQVRDYVDANYKNETLTVSSVAAYFNYTADYLSRLFSQNSRMTLSEYIEEKRISYGAKLLVDTTMSIGEITEAIGYQNASYFARVFRKHFNVSPSDYRQNHPSLERINSHEEAE